MVLPVAAAALLGWRNALAKAVVAFGLTCCGAYSYGVLYLPLCVLGALVLLAVTWGGNRLPRRQTRPSPSRLAGSI